MISLQKMNYLRRTPGGELVNDYAHHTRRVFSSGEAVVMIPARNEEDDLPATLLAIADSDVPLIPVVVENGSHDSTADVARKMGAQLIHCDIATKMAAQQMGVEYIQGVLGSNDILQTDADSLVGPKWAGEHLRRLGSLGADRAGVCLGGTIFAHGPNSVVDALRTVNAAVLDIRRAAGRALPIARGYNMSLHFDADGEFAEEYAKLQNDLFIGEEAAVRDAALRVDGVALRPRPLSSIVVTRGDRFGTLRDCVAVKRSVDNRIALYKTDYGDFTPYPGAA